ncbi:hypothetical protein, partial [Xenorhabdus sp. NBAII XenSa04]
MVAHLVERLVVLIDLCRGGNVGFFSFGNSGFGYLYRGAVALGLGFGIGRFGLSVSYTQLCILLFFYMNY